MMALYLHEDTRNTDKPALRGLGYQGRHTTPDDLELAEALNRHNESLGAGVEAVVTRWLLAAVVALALAAAIQFGLVFW